MIDLLAKVESSAMSEASRERSSNTKAPSTASRISFNAWSKVRNLRVENSRSLIRMKRRLPSKSRWLPCLDQKHSDKTCKLNNIIRFTTLNRRVVLRLLLIAGRIVSEDPTSTDGPSQLNEPSYHTKRMCTTLRI